MEPKTKEDMAEKQAQELFASLIPELGGQELFHSIVNHVTDGVQKSPELMENYIADVYDGGKNDNAQ